LPFSILKIFFWYYLSSRGLLFSTLVFYLIANSLQFSAFHYVLSARFSVLFSVFGSLVLFLQRYGGGGGSGSGSGRECAAECTAANKQTVHAESTIQDTRSTQPAQSDNRSKQPEQQGNSISMVIVFYDGFCLSVVCV
jgi:hypothetical protein